MKTVVTGVLFLIAVLCAGCLVAPKPAPPASPPETPPAATAPAATAAPAAGKSQLAVTDASGKAFLSLAAGPTVAVSGPSGALGTLETTDGRITLKDPAGKKVGSLKRDGEDFKLDDAAGKSLYKLKAKEGGFRLKDASDAMLLKIKPKDGDFKVSDGNGAELGKVKPKGDRVKINDAAGATRYTLTGGVRADVAGILLASKLTPLQQAAFLLAAKK